MTERIVVAGYYGFGNLGDELILSGVLSGLRSSLRAPEFCVISGDPSDTLHRHRVRAVLWSDITAITKEVKTAQSVIIGGGGLFHDYWGVDAGAILTPSLTGISYPATLAVLALQHQKPFMLYAVGVGPLVTDDGRELTRAIFDAATVASVRDVESLAALEDIGIKPDHVVVTADPAFLVVPPAAAGCEKPSARVMTGITRPVIAVCLRNWDLWGQGQEWESVVAACLDTFLSEEGGVAIFLPFQTSSGPLTDDDACGRRVASLMKRGDLARLGDALLSGDDAMSIVAGCDLVLGMRMHSILLASKMGVPAVGLVYDPKIKSLMTTLGLSEYALQMDGLSANRLAQLLREASADRDQIRSRLAAAQRQLTQAAGRTAGLAASLSREDMLAGDATNALVRLLWTSVSSLASKVGAWDEKTAQPYRSIVARIRDLEAAIAREASLRSEVQERYEELEARASSMAEQLRAAQASRVEQARELERTAKELNDTKAYAAEITGSRAWSLMILLWRIREAVAPRGSHIERLLGLRRRPLVPMKGERLKATSATRKAGARILGLAREVGRAALPQAVAGWLGALTNGTSFKDRSEVVVIVDADSLHAHDGPRGSPGENASDGTPREVSLVATMKNESRTIERWFESLQSQTRLPDEVIVVDGGSSDGGREILGELARSSELNIRIVDAPASNIAEGRNAAIRLAAHETIAVTDVGCVLREGWLGRMMSALEADPAIQVVAGGYEAWRGSMAARVIAELFVPSMTEVRPQSFIPSSRSIVFTKAMWRRAGGYPEWLTDAAEDTFFALALKQIPARWAFVPGAVVEWMGPGSLREALRTAFRYAAGDGEAALFSAEYWGKILRAAFYTAAIGAAASLALLARSWFAVMVALIAMGAAAWRIRSRSGTPDSSLGSAVLSLAATWTVATGKCLGFIAGLLRRGAARRKRTKLESAQLERAIASNVGASGPIIYLPTHDWSHMQQRPHHIAKALARHGYLVFFCTRNEVSDYVMGLTEVEPRLYLCNVSLDALRRIEGPVLYLGSPWHSAAVSHFRDPVTVYDHYDDLEVSSARPRDHRHLTEVADVLIASSSELLQGVRSRRQDALYVPNGVDFQAFLDGMPGPGEQAPSDLAPLLRAGKPVIGYSGALADWVDYELIRYAAETRPSFQFLLVGVDYDGSLWNSGVTGLQNVHWLGVKEFSELPAYIWRFSVGIIPFEQNAITRASSPIKMYEYMACGKPVVATPIPECARYSCVFTARDAEEFVACIDAALSRRDDDAYLTAIREIARANSWVDRVTTIHEAIEDVRRRPVLDR
jgi:polysaccharide pyruvyl transferase CsaB